MTRADTRTFKKIKPIYYADFVNTFDLNPQTGFVAMVINEQAIIQSIKNLVLTDKFERPYQPTLGSKVNSLNFEMNDTATQQMLIQTIEETIRNFEPRAEQIGAQVIQDIDNNAITISVVFTMRNIPQPIQFTLTLPRVR